MPDAAVADAPPPGDDVTQDDARAPSDDVPAFEDTRAEGPDAPAPLDVTISVDAPAPMDAPTPLDVTDAADATDAGATTDTQRTDAIADAGADARADAACPAGQRFCGTRCSPCPAFSDATACVAEQQCAAISCTAGRTPNPPGSACDPISCAPSQRLCGASCAACPTDGVTGTACGAADACVATSCAAEYTLVDGRCVTPTCPAGQRSCGGSCRACPTANVATTACSGPACLAATCADGYELSGGMCAARACAEGSLFCGSACSACPTAGASGYQCVDGACAARACAAGYTLVTGFGPARCLENAWSVERITARYTAYRSAGSSTPAMGGTRLAFTPDGTPVAAYGSISSVVLTRRGPSGWVDFARVPSSNTTLPPAVTQFVYDAAGTAHLVYFDYTPGSSSATPYAWRYVRVSPAGEPSLDTLIVASRDVDDAEGVVLGVDSEGEAHIAYNEYVGTTEGNRLYYRRTYRGAWLMRVSVGTHPVGHQVLAVDARNRVHIGGDYNGRAAYTLGTDSVFTEPRLSPTAAMNYSPEFSRQFFSPDGTPELWMVSTTSFNLHRSVITAGAAGDFTVWGPVSRTGTTRQVLAARGPSGVAMMERDSRDRLTYRAGTTAAPSTTETPNLPPVDALLDGTMVYGPDGAPQLLARGTGASSRMPLYYLRRR